MTEKIIKVEKGTFNCTDSKYESQDGYTVITDKQSIFVGIDNEQSCCETWGHATSQDDLSEFDGAELYSIEVVDTALNVKSFDELELYEPNVMFVNFQTSKGTFQIVMYNSHDGYYGHNAYLKSIQLDYETIL